MIPSPQHHSLIPLLFSHLSPSGRPSLCYLFIPLCSHTSSAHRLAVYHPCSHRVLPRWGAVGKRRGDVGSDRRVSLSTRTQQVEVRSVWANCFLLLKPNTRRRNRSSGGSVRQVTLCASRHGVIDAALKRGSVCLPLSLNGNHLSRLLRVLKRAMSAFYAPPPPSGDVPPLLWAGRTHCGNAESDLN